MKIVIDIDEDLYTRLFDNGVDNYDNAADIAKAIRKGTPLPKGYGRLIDADALIKWLKIYNERYNKRFAKTPIKDIPMYDLGHRNRNDDVISIIDRFLIIIEADKEENNEEK